MIPFKIFIAAISTLLIICNKMVLLYIDKSKSNIYKILTVCLYTVAGYYWASSIFVYTSWYAYTISGIFAFICFIYAYFTNIYNNEEQNNIVSINAESIFPVNKGIVEGIYDNGSYIGRLENGEPIIIYSDSILSISDEFKISKIVNNKIYVEKI